MARFLDIAMVLSWSRQTKCREKDSKHRWKDKFMGGNHLQRIVDVHEVRNLIWCRACAGWTSSNNMEAIEESV